MKESKVKIICILGTISAIVLFIVTCVVQVKDGYARDAGIYVSPIISYSLWILLGLCVVFMIAFWTINKKSSSKYSDRISLLLLIVLIVVGLGVNIGWKISFDREKDQDIQHENILPITLTELETAIQESDFQVIYIGRDNCPLCEYIMPDFVSYLESEHLNVLYYNTKQDREKNKEKMDKVLESIPVLGVPFIVVIENQEISTTFMGEHIVDELREYMSNQKGE